MKSRHYKVIAYISFLFLGQLILSSFFTTRADVLIEQMPVPATYTDNNLSGLSFFKYFKDLPTVDISVPTVASIPLESDSIGTREFALLDTTENELKPYQFETKSVPVPVQITITSIPFKYEMKHIDDSDPLTYLQYDVTENTEDVVVFNMVFPKPVESSMLVLDLADNVELPDYIEIMVEELEGPITVLAKTPVLSSTIVFPQTKASIWVVKMHYSQMLRIEEMELVQSNMPTVSKNFVKFLMIPGHSYKLYLNSTGRIDMPKLESGGFTDAEDVIELPYSHFYANKMYNKPDSDNDGVLDQNDNCINVANTSQVDKNNNNIGDDCEDFDKDGILNVKDNCPEAPNARQTDSDSDGIGDICDPMESRLTERYPWIPLVGIFFAISVVAVMFFYTAKLKLPEETTVISEEPETSQENTKVE